MQGLFPILIAEDDENDALILKRALQKAGFQMPYHICPDGSAVVDYLCGKPPYQDRGQFPFPRILITDLKMPKMSGLELLHWLRSHPNCSVIPTIVLTASREPSDIQRAYQMGANSYLVKPAGYEHLVGMMKLMLEYWQICEKPEILQTC